MQSAPDRARGLRWALRCLLVLGALYLLLLIPESPPPAARGAGKHGFRWQQDEFWAALERDFQKARQAGCEDLANSMDHLLGEIAAQLESLETTNLPPNAPAFHVLETNFFQLSPKVAACPERWPEFARVFARLRNLVKRQSEHWPMDSSATRERLYRLLYGGRAGVEAAMLQSSTDKLPPMIPGEGESSASPSALVHGVQVHSGDILVSRGGAATSALIARGNDFPGNYSHVALVHVDEKTKNVSVIESHIESGVGVRPIESYLREVKLRIMVLRVRNDLPAVRADPMLPHKAALHALNTAKTRHIPYDFEMDHSNFAKQFCSEVAFAAYENQNVRLWSALSHLSTPGVTAWLSALGVRHFETQEPSDLEYDPQVRVVAEWRDPETLFHDQVDNAVIDVMLEAAERGQKLGYNPWLLPVTRLMKLYSVMLNWFGKVGPIPEGMSAGTALRVQRLKADHAAIKAQTLAQAENFKSSQGYVPPYWELLRMARDPRP